MIVRPSLLLALGLSAGMSALLLGACRSADGWRDQADRDVYQLVKSRRARLGVGDGSFTIEPQPDSLRQRLLRGEEPASAPLTLVQCLEIAAENNRDYQARRESLYLSALDLTLERWRFAVHETGLLAAAVDGTGDTAETASADADLHLSKLLGTGALVVGDIGLSLTRSLTSGDTWNPIGDMGLAITQPLLRGAGKRIVEENLTQAERDLVYEVRSFERFRRTFAFDVAQRFYAILEQQDAVSNQEKNYENLQALSQRNAALTEAGRLSDIEAGQARHNELRSLDNLLQARARLQSEEDLLRIFLGLPPNAPVQFDSAELERLATQDLAPIAIDEETAAAYALASRLDHLTVLDRSEDSDRKVYVAQDALRAGLTLGVDWHNTSEPGKPAKFNFQDSTWSVSALLDLPIDRLAERNAYRQALIARESALRDTDESADRIRAELREDLRQTTNRAESWRIQKIAVDLAARRIESTDLKLQAGRADTRDLLEAQEALLDARNGASAALIDLTLARLALFLDMELLRVDESGVHAEPLPPPDAWPPPAGPVPADDPGAQGAPASAWSAPGIGSDGVVPGRVGA
jgi:outer membrane protein TolC